MASTVETGPITLDEFLRLEASAPEGVTLELIDGEVRERPMTTRTRRHCMAIACCAHELMNWLDDHPERIGEVGAGEARCRISRDPEAIVGIDVVYCEDARPMDSLESGRLYDGPPVVAVEVLSPSDTHETISDRIRLLIASGVRQVWVADPEFRTVTIHRPDAEPQLFAAGSTLTAEPELPGFACPVERLFGRVRNTETA